MIWIMTIDLPSLKEIDLYGGVFYFTKSLTLSSLLYIWVTIIDLPSLTSFITDINSCYYTTSLTINSSS